MVKMKKLNANITSNLSKVSISFFSVIVSLALYGFVVFLTNSLLILYFTAVFIMIANYGARLYLTKDYSFNFQVLLIFIYIYYMTGEVQSFYHQIGGDFLFGSHLQAFVLLNAGVIIIMSMLTVFSTPRNTVINLSDKNTSIINNEKLRKQMTFVRLFMVFYIINQLDSSLALFLSGRFNSSEKIIDFGLFSAFITAFAVISPSLLFINSKKNLNLWKIFDLILISFVFISLALIGTRFYILFSLVIFAHRVINTTKIKTFSLSVLFFLAVFIGNLVREIRGSIDNFNISNLFFFHSEGLIYYLSGLVRYYEHAIHSYFPTYSFFWSYAFVPRSIIPDKPEMIGKWILHTNSFDTQFSDRHSGSVSFVGPFFADFGYMMFFALFFLGLLISLSEKAYFKYAHEPSYRGVLYSALPALIFFGFRSFNTSLIFFISIFFVITFFSFLLKIKIK